jgi:hypothetical protein
LRSRPAALAAERLKSGVPCSSSPEPLLSKKAVDYKCVQAQYSIYTHIRQVFLTNTMSRFDARAGCFLSELLSASFVPEGPDSERVAVGNTGSSHP